MAQKKVELNKWRMVNGDTFDSKADEYNNNVYYLKHTYYIHNSIKQKVRSEAAWFIFPLIMYAFCLCVQVQ